MVLTFSKIPFEYVIYAKYDLKNHGGVLIRYLEVNFIICCAHIICLALFRALRILATYIHHLIHFINTGYTFRHEYVSIFTNIP